MATFEELNKNLLYAAYKKDYSVVSAYDVNFDTSINSIKLTYNSQWEWLGLNPRLIDNVKTGYQHPMLLKPIRNDELIICAHNLTHRWDLLNPIPIQTYKRFGALAQIFCGYIAALSIMERYRDIKLLLRIPISKKVIKKREDIVLLSHGLAIGRVYSLLNPKFMIPAPFYSGTYIKAILFCSVKPGIYDPDSKSEYIEIYAGIPKNILHIGGTFISNFLLSGNLRKFYPLVCSNEYKVYKRNIIENTSDVIFDMDDVISVALKEKYYIPQQYTEYSFDMILNNFGVKNCQYPSLPCRDCWFYDHDLDEGIKPPYIINQGTEEIFKKTFLKQITKSFKKIRKFKSWKGKCPDSATARRNNYNKRIVEILRKSKKYSWN